MRLFFILVIGLFLLTLCGCGGTTFDAADPNGSIVTMNKELSGEKAKQLSEGYLRLKVIESMQHMMSKDDQWMEEFHKSLHGMTADDIISLAATSGDFFEDRKAANEGAAAGTLKSAIFASHIQWQAGAYLDQDGDGVGEYTFISYMAGEVPSKKLKGMHAEEGDISLITGQLSNKKTRGEYQEASDYHFVVYLPDGKGGVYDRWSFESSKDESQGIDEREIFYVAYAWPKDAESGSVVYGLTQSGILMKRNGTSKPEWNELFSIKKGDAGTVFGSDFSKQWNPCEK